MSTRPAKAATTGPSWSMSKAVGPVDLLPDGEASSQAAWLAERLMVEVVCRDRAPFFAEGATAGALHTVQVADKSHLWHNLIEAAERCVADHRGCLRGWRQTQHSLPPSWRSLKTRPARRGLPDIDSQTAPAPSTRPSTNCWPPDSLFVSE